MKTPSENEDVHTQKKFRLGLYFGLLPVLLVIALILYEYLWPSSVRVYEPELLLPILNTLLFLAACVITYVAGRIYLISGLSAILWIGCGVLTLALGALTAGWMIIPFGPNVNVTIFNIGAFLASVCHIGAVVATLGERPGEADMSRKRRNVRLGYLTVLLGISLLVVLTITDLMPPFFIQGQGPTLIRQNVAGWAIVLFLVSSLFTLNRFQGKKASFLYWYALALALLALAMLAFVLQPAVGSPIGWVGRSAYVLAAIYFLISVSTGLREARAREVSPYRTILELLDPRLHWEGILATVSDAVVAYNDKGEILLWNQAAETIFGCSESEVEGQDLHQILPCMNALDLQGLIGEITEIELARQDGSQFNAEISVSSKSSTLGVITTLVVRDVTERKRAEAALLKSEKHYRSLFDNMLNGYAYCQMLFEDNRPADFIYLNVNRAFEDLTGLKNVIGQKVSEVIPGIRETDQELFEICGRVALTGIPERFETYIKTLGMWFAISVYSPRKEHFVAIFDVITERKRAEEALQESEARFRSLFENMTEGVALHELLYDDQGRAVDYRIVSTNPAFEKHTGLKPEQIQGQLASIAYGTGAAPYLEEYARVVQTGRAYAFETVFPPLQRYFHISVTSPKQGQFVTVFEDITERKQREAERQSMLEQQQALTEELATTNEELQAQAAELIAQKAEQERLNADLKAANEEMESFSYSVSHDLKAPIRAIEGFSRMLVAKHSAKLDMEAIRLLNIVCTNAKRMDHLINDLLAFSRFGQQQIKKSIIDLSVPAKQVFQQFLDQAPERDLQLAVDALPPALGDPNLIRQVMVNLLANAVKYIKPGKAAVIKVGGRTKGGETVYYVKDNGIGFDERYAQKIFGTFERLHSADEYEGTGIGLAIVKRIIERHGGRVWAEGKVNEGATFYFALPKNGA